MHQLSRMSLLVPVLTALQNGVPSGLSRPKVAIRASRSARILVTRKAAGDESTRRDGAAEPSGTRRIGLHIPPSASARYAATISHNVTSTEPSASAGP